MTSVTPNITSRPIEVEQKLTKVDVVSVVLVCVSESELVLGVKLELVSDNELVLGVKLELVSDRELVLGVNVSVELAV